MLIFSVIGFCTVLVNSVEGNCPGFENIQTDSIVPNPTLQFSAVKAIKDSVITFKDNDTILINRTKIFEMKLDCWASYPIDFTFSGHMTNQQAMVKTHVSKFIKSNGMPGYCYRINVTLFAYEEITGNYSCFKVLSPLKRSSKYIFVYSAPPGVLLQRGQNITLIVEPNQKSVILPCAISDPHVEVQLIGTDGNWVLPSEENLKFDAKVGYEMKLRDNLGDYKCQTSVSSQDYVNIKLIRPHVFDVEPKGGWIRLKKGGHLKLRCMHAKEEIYMDFTLFHSESGDTLHNQSPPGFILQRSNKSSEELVSRVNSAFYKYSASLKTTEEIKTSGFTGTGRCLTKKSNHTLYEWYFTLVNETRKDGMLDVNYIHNYCPKKQNDGMKQIILHECNNWVECNMNRCLRNEPSCQNNNNASAKCDNRWDCFPNGLIQCVTPTGAISEMFFTGFNKSNRYTNGKVAPVEDILKIGTENPMKVSKNLGAFNIKFVCEGSAFVIAGGFQWALALSNGTIIDVYANEHCDKKNSLCVRETWGRTQSIVMSTLTLDIKSSVFNETKDVVCLAPLWNSTKWINQTYHIEQDMKRILFQNVTTLSTSKGNTFTGSGVGIISTLVSSLAFLLVIQFM